MTSDSHSTPYFSDPRCAWAAAEPGHVCRDWRGVPLAGPGMDGACHAWARHEARLPAALHHRLNADADLVFALADAAATLIADDRAEHRRRMEAADAELRNTLTRLLGKIGVPLPGVARLLRERLVDAEEAHRAAEAAA